MHHVHSNHTAWPAQKVCLSSLWLENPMPWSFLNIYSSFLRHFLLRLLLEFLPLLSGILGCSCVCKFPLSFPSTHKTCHNLHWNWCIWWILPSPIFLPSGLMSYSSIWGVTSRLIKRVKIHLSRVIVLYLFALNFKTMVTWWAWPT